MNKYKKAKMQEASGDIAQIEENSNHKEAKQIVYIKRQMSTEYITCGNIFRLVQHDLNSKTIR